MPGVTVRVPCITERNVLSTMRAKGWSPARIAEKLKVSERQVFYRLRLHGLVGTSRPKYCQGCGVHLRWLKEHTRGVRGG